MYDLKSLLDHVVADIYLAETDGYARYLTLEIVDGSLISVQIPSYLHDLIGDFDGYWGPSDDDLIVDEFGSYYDMLDEIFNEDDLPF